MAASTGCQHIRRGVQKYARHIWHRTHEEHLPFSTMVIVKHCAPPGPCSLGYTKLLRSNHQLQREPGCRCGIHKTDGPYRRFVAVYPEAVFKDVEGRKVRGGVGRGGQVSGMGLKNRLRRPRRTRIRELRYIPGSCSVRACVEMGCSRRLAKA